MLYSFDISLTPIHMSEETFIEKVRSWTSLEQEQIDHLIALAPRMTDEERASAAQKLDGLHMEIKAREEVIAKQSAA